MQTTARLSRRTGHVCLLAVLLILCLTDHAKAAFVVAEEPRREGDVPQRVAGPFVWTGSLVAVDLIELRDMEKTGAAGPDGFALDQFIRKYLDAELLTVVTADVEQPSAIETIAMPAEPAAVLDSGMPTVAAAPTPHSVAEPATVALLGIAMLLVALMSWRS